MIDAQLLALRVAYLVKESGKNRLTISEVKLKTLARREVLPIPYLADLKQRLEELGYFLGTLEGGYCLLSIESLKGAPSLPMGNDALKEIENLSREELEAKCVIPVTINTIIDNSPDKQDNNRLLLKKLWTLLTQKATEKQIVTYGQLAEKCNMHHKKVIVLLESIAKFCADEKVPTLTYLAINGKSELPKVLKQEPDAAVKFAEEKTKIYTYKWQTIANPFTDEGSDNDIDTKAVPVLLLEDLSSKASIADDTNRNKSADETLRANFSLNDRLTGKHRNNQEY